MKLTATPAAARPTGRLVQRIRNDVLSSRTVDRLKRELEDELDALSSSNRTTDTDETRRDALERAVRRIWGAPL